VEGEEMVNKWLLKRARGKILAGFILVFIVGPIFFTYMLGQPIEEVGINVDLLPPPPPESLLEARASRAAIIGGIGIFLLIVGIGYLLATVILEYNKKRRYTNRSKI